MFPHDSCPLTRRDLLKWTAVLPATTIAAGRLPAAAAAQAPLPASVADLVAGNTAFALDLYAALRRETASNLIFSPCSVSQALAMVYAGAREQTAAQMQQVLGFTLEPPSLHEAFHTLSSDLVVRGNADADDEPVYSDGQLVIQRRGLRIANGLWGEQSYQFSQAYSANLARYYGAGLQETDFAVAPETAREDINAWVAQQTENHVQDIVPDGVITPATRLVLANAIWFSGGWSSTFDVEATEDGDFFLLDGSTVTVPFMFQHNHLGYGRGSGFQMVELHYAGVEDPQFAFTIILPDKGWFEVVEAGLDIDALDDAIRTLESTELLLYLSKFEFAFDAGLKPALEAMGMVDAFDPERANFSGMLDESPPEPLVINDALHKAFIGIDEEGTEAAAATIVDVLPGAAAPAPEPPPIEVRIDRPFLFAIRDTVTGTVLFLGRVLDPSS